MVVQTATAVATEVAEAAIAEAAEATVVEGTAESSISGATELSGTLSAIEKEVPREIVNENVNAALQDETFRSGLIPKIETINQHLEGQVHPETGVPFESKLVETNEGVFPNFSEHCKSEIDIPENLHKASDYHQSQYCNEQLRQQLENDRLNPDQFTDRQLEQIRNGDKPEGYTWHHHEAPGRMQLVDSEIHAKTPHTGGRSLWGGGSEAR